MVPAIRAPPNERGGNRQAEPTATAPHLYSTECCLSLFIKRRFNEQPETAINDDYMSIKLGFIGVKFCLTLRLIKYAIY